MSERSNFPASFPITRLERRKSTRGNEYFSGFLGGARVSLIKSAETGRDGCEVWHLMLSEGKRYSMSDAGSKAHAPAMNGSPRSPRVSGREAAMRDYARPSHFVPTNAPSAGSGTDAEFPF